MYDFLRGTVANLDTSGRLSLEVGGVGYSLRISEQTRSRIPLDGSIVLVYVRLVVRDDDLILFGLQQVGPTLAMQVLSDLGVGELRCVLMARDVARLRKIKGVGPKTADRIALELADKVERIPAPLTLTDAASPKTGSAAIDEAHRALVVLGFSAKDAADALAKTVRPGLDSETLLRGALSLLR